jgi:tRNA(fMet)-specific endonuclease VapC
MRYMLDTNIVSDLVRNPRGPVTQRIRDLGEAQVCTSVIVSAELLFGARRRGSAKLSAQLEAVLGALPVLSFEPPADSIYARVRTRLESLGRPIGANDLLIGSHALVSGCTLVTDNERKFGRIEDLRIENWLRGG